MLPSEIHIPVNAFSLTLSLSRTLCLSLLVTNTHSAPLGTLALRGGWEAIKRFGAQPKIIPTLYADRSIAEKKALEAESVIKDVLEAKGLDQKTGSQGGELAHVYGLVGDAELGPWAAVAIMRLVWYVAVVSGERSDRNKPWQCEPGTKKISSKVT